MFSIVEKFVGVILQILISYCSNKVPNFGKSTGIVLSNDIYKKQGHYVYIEINTLCRATHIIKI